MGLLEIGGLLLFLMLLMLGGGVWIAMTLAICGWVGLWKPIDIHLYRWWPLRAHGRLLTRLSGCPVEVVFEA